jgi:conjugal transfer pilus assembly protein TraI
MIGQWFRRNAEHNKPQPAAAVRQSVAAPTARPPIERELRYPPVDPGLPACSAEAVVQSQAELIKALTRMVSVGPDVFEQRYMAPIRALARYVHLLPASAHDEFAGPGGLFRLCLEIGVYATQSADGKIFTPTENVEARHALEPRWKYATFLAGLSCELYRPLAACVVTNSTGEQWPKFLLPLDEWLQQSKVDRYYVQWQSSTRGVVSGAEGSSVIGQILPKEQLTWLDQGSPLILRDIMSMALGQSRPGDSILGETVERIRDEVIRRDESTRRSRYGRLALGHHLEAYLFDAARTMVESRQWAPQDKDGPIYFGTDGLYLEWPRAAEALREHLIALGLPGVPRSPQTLAEVLGKSGALIPQDSGQWTWSLIVSEPRLDVPVVKKTALRFKDPAAVLGLVTAKPLERPFAEAMVVRVSESSTTVDAAAEVYASLPNVPVMVAGQPRPDPQPEAQQATLALQRPGEIADVAPPRITAVAKDHAPLALGGALPDDLKEVSHATHVPEQIRRTLKTSDAEMIGRWVMLFKQSKFEHVCEHPGRQIAVSKDFVESLDLDFSKVVATIEKYQWLGRPESAGRGARVGEIQFADAKRFGFVIAAEAAKMLGFRS